MTRIRNISLAIAAAVVISLLLGLLWLSGAVISLVLTDNGVPLAWAGLEIQRLFFNLGQLGLLYSLVILPILFSILFYRALASGDLWGALKGRLRLFLILFLIGFFLHQGHWLSGYLLV